MTEFHARIISHALYKKGKANYMILQLHPDEIPIYGFLSSEMMKKKGLKADYSRYQIKYAGEIPAEYRIENDNYLNAFLEYLFEQFNINRPLDFNGHSMSVSDVVIVDHPGCAIRTYYCDAIGFKQINTDQFLGLGWGFEE